MYLKSLVLKGFKSFADRSVLSMEPGITAIVGPNGSGKSNISDAVLWVLGERNAKNLRGQAMEDVIFAGSSARKSVSVAEVQLVLDNSDGTLPVEYDEVSIGRRVYRNGESEYLINGVQARRMDVLDILHDSGLGTGTHSIISQGSLDSILQSKPEDRRALIEEAAGVLKHKQRKAKSERKLERMDAHLARVNDVAAEVERQLGPLERKAKRARAYQGLSAELSDLSLALAVDDLRTLRAQWAQADEREKVVAEELEQRKAAIQQAEASADELQQRIQQENVDAGEIARKHRRASSASERFDSATMLLHEKRRAAQARETELRVGREAAKAKRAQAEADRVQAAGQVAEVSQQRQQADALVATLTERRQQLISQRRELDVTAQRLEQQKQRDEREQERSRRDLAEMKEALANGMAHARLIEGRGQELASQMERQQAELAAKTQVAADAQQALEQLAAREAEARSRVSQSFAQRDQARAALDAARDAANEVASQIAALQEIERAQAAQSGPALSWTLENRAAVDATLAPVAHAVRAQAGDEALVERLLGSDVAALLVADDEHAGKAARLLAQQGAAGEVVLVPRAGNAAAASVALARAAAAAGAGRALVDSLTFQDIEEQAVYALLGDVVVCPSVEAAFAAHRTHAGVRFVTEDGCLVWPSGKVTIGGPLADDGQGVLARARKLEALQAQQGDAQRARQKAEDALKQVEEAVRAAQADSLKLSQELAQLRGGNDSAQAEVKKAEEALASLRAQLEDVERQRGAAHKSVEDAKPRVQQLEDSLQQLAKSLEEGAAQAAQVQQDLAPLRKGVAQTSEELSEAKLNATVLTERETYAARIVDARVREIEGLDASAGATRDDLLRKVVAQARIHPLLAAFEELSLSVRKWTQLLEDQATQAETASSGLHAAANEARAAARAAHESFDDANARLSSVRVDKGRLEVQVEGAVNAIVQDCSTPLERALELPPLEDRPAAEESAFKLQRRIANMGTINPDAANEYEELKTRYDYLTAQLDDLHSARRSLSKIVRVIDARMKQDFIQTYESVNRNFSEIFAVLFPGGSAQLTLVDPDDLENTGVEVTAQPRGKRITKMMLMSGGEKSLTALALLFAVYRIRSTPFYILDEVEAALDDSNLRRLTMYLDSLRDQTQLIMITHQRRTMEMSDVLFGVSMQGDGVTKVISQKLDQALRHAE